eukprot:scaffold1154_cov141-Skeletonema_menzelii.AAC.2
MLPIWQVEAASGPLYLVRIAGKEIHSAQMNYIRWHQLRYIDIDDLMRLELGWLSAPLLTS